MQKIITKIPVIDIDWTLITGGNPHHVDAYIAGINSLFDELNVTADDVRIDSRQGQIDKQILFEILRENNIEEEIARRSLPEILVIATEYFLTKYRNEKTPSDSCLPGAKALFHALKKRNVPIGILSGNIQGIAVARLNKMGLLGQVVAGAYGDMAFERGELYSIILPFLEIALERRIQKEQCVVIDDSVRGIQVAVQQGVPVIGVATGKSTAEELLRAGAIFTVKNLVLGCDEITAYLCS